MRQWISFVLLLAASLVAAPAASQAIDTAFTYQGELRQLGSPANAVFDFQFRLYDDANGGVQIGPTLTLGSVGVVDGRFSVPLDFGPGQFLGDAQWLDVSVRQAGGASFEVLVPRTAITATPYSIGAFTALADSVTGLSVVDGTLGASDIDPAEIQQRVSGACSGGQAIASISDSGQVTCASGSGGTITEVLPGTGLVGGGDAGSVTLGIAPGGVGAGEIDPSSVQARITGVCEEDQYLHTINADGTVVCATDQVGSSGWGLTGNAGTNPATDFIGTTDNQPLVLRSNSQVVGELQSVALPAPVGSHTANVRMGSPANQIVAGVRGATIGGGGAPAGDVNPDFTGQVPNRVAGHYGTVGGGLANVAGLESGTPDDAWYATIAGGVGNQALATGSTVGGGEENGAIGQGSVVAGGEQNNAVANFDTVSGGLGNIAGGGISFVGGGGSNTASGPYSTIGGGLSSQASGWWSTVAGGQSNNALGDGATVSGGSVSTASGLWSTVPGGNDNCAGGNYSWAGGRQAKVRPGIDPGFGSGACTGLFSYPGGSGDSGTFVWADSQGFDFTSTGDDQFLIRANGGVGINTNSPNGNSLRVVGTIRMDTLGVGGATTLCRNGNLQIGFCSSSRRYKDEVEGLDLGLEAVDKMRPVAYRWKQSGDADVGFVAEEIAELDPRLATYDNGIVEGVKYERLTAVLANAVQELARRDREHTEAVSRLDAENAALREELAALRALIMNPSAEALSHE